MCGDGAFGSVIFATTKWDRKNQYAEKHQRQLETEYWKSLIKKGAQVHRVDRGHESAWAIIDTIISTVEVHGGMTTSERAAGKYIASQASKRTPISKGIIRKITSLFRNMHNWFF